MIDHSPQLYLASASPRRREILAQMGLRFRVLVQDVDESPLAGEPAQDYVRRLAQAKAEAGRRDLEEGDGLPVLGADTVVLVDGRLLGKPRHREEALEILRLLSGREHRVVTAVALAAPGRHACAVSDTAVEFRPLSEREMAAYWDTGEPRDKAGAYAIQGLGALFVRRIAGSYSGVVGLPICETAALLAEFGLETAELLEGRRT